MTSSALFCKCQMKVGYFVLSYHIKYTEYAYCVGNKMILALRTTISSLIFNVLVSNEKGVERTYVSKADTRKNMRRMRNGPGRNQCLGGRAENSKGFSPNSFDRVLLDAPCSALGLRPRLFAAEVGNPNWYFFDLLFYMSSTPWWNPFASWLICLGR